MSFPADNTSMECVLRSLGAILEHIRVRYPIDLGNPLWYKDQPNLWFRGQSDSNWDLEPKALRSNFVARAGQCENWIAQISDGKYAPYTLSGSLFKQLRARGHHLLNETEALSTTDSYFIAQHHGLPTCLLDWTTNLLVAAFFAAVERPKSDGVVFLMQARKSIGGEESSDINSDSDEVKEFVDTLLDSSTLYCLEGGAPYRIMPNMRLGRMLQQSARFTLHYPGCRKLTEIDGLIEKIVIPHDAKAAIRNELRTLSVDWGTIYPDLPNFIRQIREEAGIE